MTNVSSLRKVFIMSLLLYDNLAQYCVDKGKEDPLITECNSDQARYLLYDVQPGEGFNLLRDVYLRMATLTKMLQNHGNWILVLPPWSHMYHWKTKISQSKLPWSNFFDVSSLNAYVPVIEFETYLKLEGQVIDNVYYLQQYDEPWSGHWEEKYNFTECRNTKYQKHEQLFRGKFYGYDDVFAKQVSCVYFQGSVDTIIPMITGSNAISVFIDRAENLLHYHYGGQEYWLARKSMKFNQRLRSLAHDFIQNNLIKAKLKMLESLAATKGLPYLSVHLRRKDFLFSRKGHIPSLKSAAFRIKDILNKYKLEFIFLATDGSAEDVSELKRHLENYPVMQFKPSHDEIEAIGDGGVAIVDQIICSYSRYFIGSYESTFSFRIQEEREILKLDPETTFNRFCGDDELDCQQPAKWKLVE